MVTAAQKAAASKPAKKAAAPVPEHARANLKLVATNAAVARLKDVHRDEYEGFLAEECGKRGVPYSRTLTEQEKAAKQIADYVRKYGALILPDDSEVAEILGQDVAVEPVTDEVEDEADVATDDPEAVEDDVDTVEDAQRAAISAADID